MKTLFQTMTYEPLSKWGIEVREGSVLQKVSDKYVVFSHGGELQIMDIPPDIAHRVVTVKRVQDVTHEECRQMGITPAAPHRCPPNMFRDEWPEHCNAETDETRDGFHDCQRCAFWMQWLMKYKGSENRWDNNPWCFVLKPESDDE